MINKIWPFALLASSLVSGGAISEEKDWWFDVEVILFSRDAEQTDEVFDPVVKPIDVHRSRDLLGTLLAPDLSYLEQMLPQCEMAEKMVFPAWLDEQGRAVVNSKLLDDQEFSLPYWFSAPNWRDMQRMDCLYGHDWFAPVARTPMPDNVPVHINGITQRYPTGPHILGAEQLELNSVYKQLVRLRGVQPMLHLGWRQQVVFGRNNAKSVRLFAGHNYSSEFDYWGNVLKHQGGDNLNSPLDNAEHNQNVVEKIELALNNDSMPAIIKKKEEFVQQEFSGEIPQQIWQLDGLFKVYLQYINRVPYLHIDSHFNYRQPGVLEHDSEPRSGIRINAAPEQFLYSYPFDQLRRVISQELHYFDHPYFGMIVQIRRYNIPERPPEQETQ
ncbi:CsiV family protein [Neptunicella sp. SCSIO 80796]|uniref:CsiV family protein n=1 Tax=Neptunicella plasticusilytica TaxID=3117012 RepID=UPI003A4DAAA4